MEIKGFGSLVNPDDIEWFETPGGNSVKVLRVSEETIYLANVHGAIAFYGEAADEGGDRPILAISDWRGMKAIQDAQNTNVGR